MDKYKSWLSTDPMNKHELALWANETLGGKYSSYFTYYSYQELKSLFHDYIGLTAILRDNKKYMHILKRLIRHSHKDKINV